ncbi:MULTISPECIES: YbjN domain-containing protein [unclassified Paracoccus (in: a-proteobacteria)]|uniref:YbjN domain-containing protein n=1 Tax=unclassified Paracoccus (in: a-proteobacteria) TaxID=2688777 RepID=UPI0016029DC6|nr:MULTISPECIES: YbjN domain-containing protein [unclassified Paracoccus (in: a-proteobacteria)]MBB1491904.1 YbjN domain-containing protein [Paracoccus sp. MC1854]MBB1498233.1 YbjN domain-containing protein [Paracoccus sp. MC1862]QQO45722.1 YbjN domain-containing protein [Paracoccus sp. MC1862]
MAQPDHDLLGDESHPIDLVEAVAARRDWDFARLADDQIAMTVEGLWRIYALTLAWSERDEVLRLICSFDLDPPEARMGALHEALNLANDAVWEGGFSFWAQHRQMVWRYGLVLAGGTVATPEQIDRMIRSAIENSERFYPAFQLACRCEIAPRDAMGIAIAEPAGRA